MALPGTLWVAFGSPQCPGGLHGRWVSAGRAWEGL